MMSPEFQHVWQEVLADITTPAAAWQLALIAIALFSAYSMNDVLRSYVARRMIPEQKLAIGSVNRVLFPLSSFVLIWMAKLILSGSQHVSMLEIASKLLLAMAAIRLIVYAMRYVFLSSGWLKTAESLVAWSIWILLALHVTGVLQRLAQALEQVEFSIGKNSVNLLLILQGLLTVLFTLFMALWLSRLIENRLMAAEQMSMNIRVVITKLVRIAFIFFAVLIALSAVGLDITLLSVFGGAVGVGLGFGLQRIASNYVSGFIILLDKSMQIGDVISVDKHYGVVQDLRSRYMVLGKLDGTHVIIPNESLITNAVINHSLTEHRGRVQIEFAVSANSPLELALQLMQDVAKQQARVLQTPSPAARIKGFSENGVELTLTVWVADPENGALSLQSALFLDIWKVFKKNKIGFKKSDSKQE